MRAAVVRRQSDAARFALGWPLLEWILHDWSFHHELLPNGHM
jgi:hypothetical protein